jgi:hypothetical protein
LVGFKHLNFNRLPKRLRYFFAKIGEISGLSELQRSLKIMRRASEPQLMAVQIEAAERNDRGLELMVGEGYRIKIGAGFCSTTLRRLLELLGSC